MKNAITIEDIRRDKELNNSAMLLFKNVKSLKDFGDYSTIRVFVYLFGKKEGERLWRCYKVDADNIYALFFTYLNNEQKFILAASLGDEDNLRMAAAIYEM